jgi:hypothetical protein
MVPRAEFMFFFLSSKAIFLLKKLMKKKIKPKVIRSDTLITT